MNPALLEIFLVGTVLQALANIALIAACATFVFKNGGADAARVVKSDLLALESSLKAEILEIKSKL
jgi:hypothetical protein